MIIAGIDPGLAGAIAIYDVDRERIVNVLDMPTLPWGEKKRHVDVASLSTFVLKHRADTAALERVNAMPSIDGARRMGAASAFRFGMVYGEVRGALIALGCDLVDVTPVTWKDLFELRKRDKDDARQMAVKLFPDAAHWLERKKDVGRAEAMLIARWAAQNRFE